MRYSNNFYYDDDTYEFCFNANVLVSYWDRLNHTATFYAVKNGNVIGRTEEVTITKTAWEKTCVDIQGNPDLWEIQYLKGHEEEGGYLFHHLEDMPFDRWEDNRYIHATGREYLEINGDMVTEYEDETDDCSRVVSFYSESVKEADDKSEESATINGRKLRAPNREYTRQMALENPSPVKDRTPGTCRRLKGIHNTKKQWKKGCRRANRRNNKVNSNYQVNIDMTALENEMLNGYISEGYKPDDIYVFANREEVFRSGKYVDGVAVYADICTDDGYMRAECTDYSMKELIKFGYVD